MRLYHELCFHHLDYEMELRSFSVEYYPNGSPSAFAAEVRLGDDAYR